MFTAWLSSCVSCFWSQEDQVRDRPKPSTSHRGVEREMKVCHSQPHLVPPMKLVFYDNLPSPGLPSRSSSRLPSWVGEGRNLASRASNRASIFIRRNTRKRPVISAPSAFRRVDPPPSRLRSLRPLELSIYMPGNRLSDLPDFYEFGVDDTNGLPSAPPRALSSPYESSTARRRQSAPHQLARKPVGSRASRGSLATIDRVADSAHPIPTSNPLIPHFSVFISEPLSIIRRLSNHLRSNSETIPADSASRTLSLPSPLDKPLPTTPARGTTWPKTFQPTSTILTESDLLSESNPSAHHADAPYKVHERTESNSSSTSSTMTSYTGGHRTLPSLSSAMTAATTMQMSLLDANPLYKEIEPLPLGGDLNEKIHSEPKITALPRVYGNGDSVDQISEDGYEYDGRFPHSNVGLAF